MSDNLRASAGTTTYRSGQEARDYGRSASPEAGAAYEAYGRNDNSSARYSGRSYRSERDYRGDHGDHGWRDMADSRTVWTIAIGAGLGLLGALLVSASGQPSRTGWQGMTDRQRSRRGSSNRGFVEKDETSDLIASNKVEGTAVYDPQGNKLGEIKHFMVGKRSGRVAYAVLSFGGLLGFGTNYYPLPWNALDYDPEKGGYVVNLDKDRLKSAPSHSASGSGFSDPGYGRQVSEYWLIVG